MQALAGPDAGEGNVDVAPGFETREADHPLGEIDDLHRLAHIEHVNRHTRLPGLERMACRRDHKVARLADGHEVAHHLRMRHRERTARLDLRLEFRHHRTIRGENVAKTHCDQSHGALVWRAAPREVVIERLTIHLGKAL